MARQKSPVSTIAAARAELSRRGNSASDVSRLLSHFAIAKPQESRTPHALAWRSKVSRHLAAIRGLWEAEPSLMPDNAVSPMRRLQRLFSSPMRPDGLAAIGGTRRRVSLHALMFSMLNPLHAELRDKDSAEPETPAPIEKLAIDLAAAEVVAEAASPTNDVDEWERRIDRWRKALRDAGAWLGEQVRNSRSEPGPGSSLPDAKPEG